MALQGGKYVCGKCGSYFIPGIAPAGSRHRAH